MDDNSEIYSEQQLIERVAVGDNSAFESLFNRYWDRVYSFAVLMTKSPPTAQDISQEVFLAIFTTREQLTGIANFRGYLFQMVKFKVLSRLRHEKVETAYKAFLSGRIDWEPLSADAGLQEKNLHEAITQAISLLPQQQRKAFELSRLQGLTHEQISVAMGISKRTVKDYIVRAIAFLRKHLHEEGLLLLSAAAVLAP